MEGLLLGRVSIWRILVPVVTAFTYADCLLNPLDCPCSDQSLVTSSAAVGQLPWSETVARYCAGQGSQRYLWATALV
jgi:hypothetical protein